MRQIFKEDHSFIPYNDRLGWDKKVGGIGHQPAADRFVGQEHKSAGRQPDFSILAISE
jgi:hypothetical protein